MAGDPTPDTQRSADTQRAAAASDVHAADPAHHQHVGHMHCHGPGCGHEAISHEQHVDYLHGEHLHTRHGGHYDDCSRASRANLGVRQEPNS